jgi:lipopolysaccharide export system ATP-binding protein
MTQLSKKEQKLKLETLLDEFRLQHVRKNNGDTLSGGERRRTEIARALAVDPKFILLDEPFAGVDPIAVEDIQTIVARLKYKNIGILITDHNVNETLSICDRAYLLIDGKIFKHGTAEELANDEQVRRLYLGRNFELKRKDYLHEEVRASKITLDKLLYSVESALANTENLKKNAISLVRSPGFENSNSEEDLQLKEYWRFMDEIKHSLYDFAAENKKADFLVLLDQLYSTPNLDTETLLNNVDIELKQMDA